MPVSVGGINIEIGLDYSKLQEGTKQTLSMFEDLENKLKKTSLEGAIKGNPFSKTIENINTLSEKLNQLYLGWSKNIDTVDLRIKGFTKKSLANIQEVAVHLNKILGPGRDIGKKGKPEIIGKGILTNNIKDIENLRETYKNAVADFKKLDLSLYQSQEFKGGKRLPKWQNLFVDEKQLSAMKKTLSKYKGASIQMDKIIERMEARLIKSGGPPVTRSFIIQNIKALKNQAQKEMEELAVILQKGYERQAKIQGRAVLTTNYLRRLNKVQDPERIFLKRIQIARQAKVTEAQLREEEKAGLDVTRLKTALIQQYIQIAKNGLTLTNERKKALQQYIEVERKRMKPVEYDPRTQGTAEVKVHRERFKIIADLLKSNALLNEKVKQGINVEKNKATVMQNTIQLQRLNWHLTDEQTAAIARYNKEAQRMTPVAYKGKQTAGFGVERREVTVGDAARKKYYTETFNIIKATSQLNAKIKENVATEQERAQYYNNLIALQERGRNLTHEEAQALKEYNAELRKQKEYAPTDREVQAKVIAKRNTLVKDLRDRNKELNIEIQNGINVNKNKAQIFQNLNKIQEAGIRLTNEEISALDRYNRTVQAMKPVKYQGQSRIGFGLKREETPEATVGDAARKKYYIETFELLKSTSQLNAKIKEGIALDKEKAKYYNDLITLQERGRQLTKEEAQALKEYNAEMRAQQEYKPTDRELQAKVISQRNEEVKKLRESNRELNTEIKNGINVEKNRAQLRQNFLQIQALGKNLTVEEAIALEQYNRELNKSNRKYLTQKELEAKVLLENRVEIDKSRDALRKYRAEQKLGINVKENDKRIGEELSNISKRNGQLTKEETSILKKYNKELDRTSMAKFGTKQWFMQRATWFIQLRAYWEAYRLVSQGVKELIEYQDQLARAMRTARSEISSVTQVAQQYARAMREAAKRTGAEWSDIGEVLYQLGSAGLTAEESLAGLDNVMNLIIGTEGDAREVTKSVAGIYNNFKNTITEVTGEEEKLKLITDVMAAAWQKHQIEISELTEGLKHSSAVATQVGVSFQELTALLAVANDHMIKSGRAGRMLTTMWSHMLRKQREFTEAFNLEKIFDPTEPFNFIKVMGELSKRFKEGTMSTYTMAQAFEYLGIRATPEFITFLKHWDEFEKTNKELSEAAGSSAALAEKRLDSLGKAFKRLSKNIAASLLGDEVTNAFAWWTRKLNDLLDKMHKVEEAQNKFVEVDAVLGAVVAVRPNLEFENRVAEAEGNLEKLTKLQADLQQQLDAINKAEADMSFARKLFFGGLSDAAKNARLELEKYIERVKVLKSFTQNIPQIDPLADLGLQEYDPEKLKDLKSNITTVLTTEQTNVEKLLKLRTELLSIQNRRNNLEDLMLTKSYKALSPEKKVAKELALRKLRLSEIANLNEQIKTTVDQTIQKRTQLNKLYAIPETKKTAEDRQKELGLQSDIDAKNKERNKLEQDRDKILKDIENANKAIRKIVTDTTSIEKELLSIDNQKLNSEEKRLNKMGVSEQVYNRLNEIAEERADIEEKIAIAQLTLDANQVRSQRLGDDEEKRQINLLKLKKRRSDLAIEEKEKQDKYNNLLAYEAEMRRIITQRIHEEEVAISKQLTMAKITNKSVEEQVKYEIELAYLEQKKLKEHLKYETRSQEQLAIRNKIRDNEIEILNLLEKQRRAIDPIYDALQQLREQTKSIKENIAGWILIGAGTFGSGFGKIITDVTGGFQEQRQEVAELEKDLEDLDTEYQQAFSEGNIERAAEIRDRMGEVRDRINDLEDPIKNIGEMFRQFFKELIDNIRTAINEWIAMKAAIGIIKTGGKLLGLGGGDFVPDLSQSLDLTGLLDNLTISTATGGVLPKIKAFQSFSSGGMTSRPTLAVLGDNKSKKELVIPEENIKANSVSGYVKDRDEGKQPINIINLVREQDIAGVMAQTQGQRVIVNTVMDFNKKNPIRATV